MIKSYTTTLIKY